MFKRAVFFMAVWTATTAALMYRDGYRLVDTKKLDYLTALTITQGDL